MQRVLVVDDDEDFRSIVSLVLEGLGFEAVQARGGVEALAELDTQVISVVVTDWEMPGMHGGALISAIRSRPRYTEVPVIVVSGSSPTLHECVPGAVEIVDKLELDKLLSSVARAILRAPHIAPPDGSIGSESTAGDTVPLSPRAARRRRTTKTK